MLRAIAHHMDSTPHPKTQTCTESPTRSVLPSRPIQIQTLFNPGDHNSGEHVQLHALCEDGSIWLQYSSSGKSNVPNDGMWLMILPPNAEVSDRHAMKPMKYPAGMLYTENLPKLAEEMNTQAEIDEGYRDAHAARGQVVGDQKAARYALRAQKLRAAAAALIQENA